MCIHNAEVGLYIQVLPIVMDNSHKTVLKKTTLKKNSESAILGKGTMRTWTLIVLLSSAIAADDSDYRQQILQAHIVAPAGQPVPLAQVAWFPLCSWCLELSASSCCTTQEQVSVNRSAVMKEGTVLLY